MVALCKMGSTTKVMMGIGVFAFEMDLKTVVGR
jgi:hypothetical protein